MNDGSDLFSGALIMQYEHRTDQVWPAISSRRVAAMAEAAGRNEERLAAFDGGGIGRGANREEISHCLLLGPSSGSGLLASFTGSCAWSRFLFGGRSRLRSIGGARRWLGRRILRLSWLLAAKCGKRGAKHENAEHAT